MGDRLSGALCGEVDRPLPIWLIATMKYALGIECEAGPDVDVAPDLVRPEYQVVIRMALSRASFSSPQVVTASRQSGIVPPSSRSSRPM